VLGLEAFMRSLKEKCFYISSVWNAENVYRQVLVENELLHNSNGQLPEPWVRCNFWESERVISTLLV